METRNSIDMKTIKFTEKEEKEYRRKFNKKYKKALIKSRRKEEKRILKQIRKGSEIKKTHLTTTKKILIFIIANCTIIEFYSMFIVYHFQEVSILETLISAVVAESFSFLIYCVKSYFETKSEKNNELEYYRIDNTQECDVNENDVDDGSNNDGS